MKFPIRAKIKIIVIFLGLAIAAAGGDSFGAAAQQKTFTSADEAVKAAVAAARANNEKDLLAIFGPQAKELLSSGDAVADKERRANFLAAYDQKNRLVAEKENRILVIGNNDWPFPIPLVKKGETWIFDTDQGKEEILNRRIGQNELDAIQVTLAYVDAQREYAMKVHASEGLLEYAQKFRSDSERRTVFIGKRKRAKRRACSDRLPRGQEAKATKRATSRCLTAAIITKFSPRRERMPLAGPIVTWSRER